ncbi:hypothetical protein KIN20_011720 [Parelaphostrongylus tenuis]|uniref:beta-mannosidase n=1 Tax=Parelaphostrongylus tenuis TaxID=148309 RepID=A0AAD5QMA2_PARTN|nr:hypothetical protein KIN20_011720 [Parelaphostrongylus tenuis]
MQSGLPVSPIYSSPHAAQEIRKVVAALITTEMTAITALLVFGLFIDASAFQVIDLNGVWSYHSDNKTIYSRGHVPGDVFSDLHRKAIIPDPLYGDNHLALQWVSRDNWTYTRTFYIAKSILKFHVFLLRMRGIDTVSSVILNRKFLISTNNQFVEYFVDVSGILREENKIEVRFTSPVLYAKEKSDQYYKSRQHFVPPICPPYSYHGECHPNFIRKAQYSFSWDWGPAIPTMGIWKPIDIVAFDHVFVDDISWITERTHE